MRGIDTLPFVDPGEKKFSSFKAGEIFALINQMPRDATSTRYILGSAECSLVPFIENIVVYVYTWAILLKTGIHEDV